MSRQQSQQRQGGYALEVKNLYKAFTPRGRYQYDPAEPGATEALKEAGGVLAVKDVSLRLRRGEFFVVMGLSGSGKSTFIRCLLRLVEPTAGEIWMGGDEVTGLSGRELTEFRREKAAMVFQHYGLLPHKTVLQNAAFGLTLKGSSKAERLQNR